MHAITPDPATLPRHPVLRTGKAEELRGFLDGKSVALDLVHAAEGPIDARIGAAHLPDLDISYVQYGAEAIATTGPERQEYRLQVAVRGSAATSIGDDSHSCAPGRGVLTSHLGPARVRLSGDCGRLLVHFPAAALTRQLAAMLGEAVAAPLEFAPRLEFESGAGLTVARLIGLAVDELARADSALASPVAAMQLQQLLTTALLLGHRSNYSHRLAAPHARIFPRDVRRAIDYIHAHLDEPVEVATLVAVSGVPGRTLYKHFRDATGLSPLAYVRKLRFERAHAELRRGAGPTVTAVAMRWGFEHMGRFAVGYRRMFGESPSETLARGR